MRLKSLLLASIVWTLPALAADAPGTQEGAAELSADLKAYTGAAAFDSGVLKVSPDSAGYRVTLDPTSILKAIDPAAGQFSLLPYSVVIADRGDGTWTVTSSDPIKGAMDTRIDGLRQAMTIDFGPANFDGIFSPALGSFLNAKGHFERGSMTVSDPQSDVDVTFGVSDYAVTGTPAGPDGVDLALSQTMAGFKETVAINPNAATGVEAMQVIFSAEAGSGEFEATAMKNRAIMDLWAFVVTHAKEEKLGESNQAKLKTLLKAAMPLFVSMKSTTDLRNISISSPFANVALSGFETDFSGTGIARDASYSIGTKLSGIKANSPLLPAWSLGLVPTDMAIDMRIVGLDTETAAKLAIDKFDFDSDPALSSETEATITAAFKAAGPKMVLGPSRLKSDLVEVTAEGEVTLSDNPAYTLTFEARGLDEVIALLQKQSASDPSLNQIVGGLAMAKGFAKPLPDGRSQWVLTGTGDGAVALNGFQMSGPTVPTDPVAPDAADDDSGDENQDGAVDPAQKSMPEQ